MENNVVINENRFKELIEAERKLFILQASIQNERNFAYNTGHEDGYNKGYYNGYKLARQNTSKLNDIFKIRL